MIYYEHFNYNDEPWNTIREQVLDDLGVDVDQIERQVTVRHTGPDFKESITGMETLRERIESTVGQYRFRNDANRLSPRHEELNTLREDAERLRDSILDTVAVPFNAGYGVVVPARLDGVDADMMTATRDYFTKLLANLDRMIDRAGTRQRGNARKPARDQCWVELLAIWIELGGEPTGKAAAGFLFVASKPVMGSAVPDVPSIMRWLKRRQSRPAMDRSVLRLATR